MKLFLAYTWEERPEIVALSSFSCRPTFRQTILKIASVSCMREATLLEKLLEKPF